MDRTQALQKIKKCLALAASNNPNESAIAMRQAQALMQLHGLSEVDVSLQDVHECTKSARNVNAVRWEVTLAVMVAEAFGCESISETRYTSTSLRKYSKKRQYIFVGIHPTAEVAGYAFEVLSRQCAKDRRAFMAKQPKNCKPQTKVARGDLYAEGWLSGISSKLTAFAAKPEHAALVKAHMERQHPNLKRRDIKDRAIGRNVTGGERSAGHQDGQKVNLNHAVSAPVSAELEFKC